MGSREDQQVEDASRAILQELLTEFRNRNLSAKDLRDGYQGLAPTELKRRCLGQGIDEVDFDLAMDSLTSEKFIGTGPIEPFKVSDWSPIVIIGGRSKNEYSYLNEKGYNEAKKVKPVRASSPGITNIHNVNGSNSRITIGTDNSTNTVMELSEVFRRIKVDLDAALVNDLSRDEVVTALEEVQHAKSKETAMAKYRKFVGIVADHAKIVSLIAPHFGSLLHWIETLPR